MSVILEAKHISKNFGLTQALKDVSVTIDEGEVIGLIGENGSGKSTLSSIISGVYPQSEGELTLDGKPYKPADTLDAQNHGISMIAQEMGTLPGIKVADNLFIGKEQLFTKHGVVDRKKMYQEARKALEKIGIDNIHPEDPIIKYSLEERKLIEVVRALYTNPRIFIVDETTTALSQRGRDIIYQVIKNMKKENKTVLFISHDLSMVKHISDRVGVMYLGSFVELASNEVLYSSPKHPYTQALISAIPEADPDYESQKEKTKLEGEVPSPLNPPSGCKFRTRCKYATERCAQEPPVFREVEPDHFVACHLFDKDGEK